MNYAKHLIGGRLTRDNELRYTPKGTAVCGNSVAVNRKWRDANGNEKEEVTFYDVVAYGSTAENMANYTIKGSPVLIEARMKNEQWEDQATGQPRRRNVFVIENVQFLERADAQAQRAAGRTQGQPAQQQPRQAQHPQNGQDAFYDTDDDIPF